jgi:hypothetical protein
VAKTGDAMTGPLSIPIAPTVNDQVTNKLYVDSAVAAKSSTIISDTPPSSAPDGTIWYESDSGITYVRYNDGNSSQWVALLATGGDAVLYNTTQTLTEAQASRARQNIAAAPFDAMGYYGIQYNGSGEIDQTQLGNVTAVNGFPYFVDGWNNWCGGAIQALASPYQSAPLPGFPWHVRQFTTAAVSGALAAGDFGNLIHYIEGYRIARLAWGSVNAQPLTLGFWIRTPFPGNVAVTVAQGSASHSYTVDVACGNNVWEWKTITVPGCTAGTWPSTNTTGMQIIFCFGSGSTYRGTPNVWNTTFAISTTATTNFHNAGSNMSSICGLMVLPGSQAPNAGRSAFVQRPWDQELVQCRRYFQKSNIYATAPGAGGVGPAWDNGSAFAYITGLTSHTTACGHEVRFDVSMRAPPTITVYSPTTGTAGKARDDANSMDCPATIDYISEQGFRYYVATTAVATNHNSRMHWKAEARL